MVTNKQILSCQQFENKHNWISNKKLNYAPKQVAEVLEIKDINSALDLLTTKIQNNLNKSTHTNQSN